MLDISNDIPLLTDPFDVPLYLRLPSKPPSQQAAKHEWQEEGLEPSIVALTAALNDTQTVISLSAADTSALNPGDLIKVRSTGEILRVTSNASATSVNVARGYAGTSGAAGASNTDAALGKCDIIGQAVPDGADPQGFITTNRVPLFNFNWELAGSNLRIN